MRLVEVSILAVHFPACGSRLLGCLLAWTLVQALFFFSSPFLGCFLFIKVGRVSFTLKHADIAGREERREREGGRVEGGPQTSKGFKVSRHLSSCSYETHWRPKSTWVRDVLAVFGLASKQLEAYRYQQSCCIEALSGVRCTQQNSPTHPT